MRWQSVVDFLVLAVTVYLVLRWGRDARAIRVSFAILGLRVSAVLARQIDLPIASGVLDAATLVALILVLIVYQAELRHALARLDVVAWLLPQRQVTAERSLHAIVAAAFSLSRAHRGALIVIAGREPVDELVEGGVPLGGEISPEILEAIFRKVSPVHDGATIIEGDHIARVSAILPLTQRPDIARAYGTRHRAAMGLAERCDALVIAVSEERGEVSLAHRREIATIETPEALVRRVREVRGERQVESKRAVRGLLFGDLGLKATALGLAALLWGVSFLVPRTSVRSVTVPVELVNVPPDMEISYLSAHTVQVQLRGSAWALDSASLTTVVARFDLRGAAEGPVSFSVQQSALNLPLGLVIEGVAPQTVSVRLVRRPPRR